MKKYSLANSLRHLIWGSALALALPLTLNAQDIQRATPEESGFSSAGVQALADGMRAAVDEGNLAGIVSALLRDGKLVHMDAYGYQDIENQIPASEDTLFRIYSMTKPVTGVALMMLVEEGKLSLDDAVSRHIPELAKNLLEEVSFVARDSEYVDAKSGVSARLSISAMENLMAAGKLRMIETQTQSTTIRLVDFMSIIPSITGKIELVYEGEQEGADEVAKMLIDAAVLVQFNQLFPRIPKLEKAGTKTPYSDVIHWFEKNYMELNYTDTDEVFLSTLKTIKPLNDLIEKDRKAHV
jgi:hypothetical protein